MGGTTEASFVPDEAGPFIFVHPPLPIEGEGLGGKPMIEDTTIIERLAALHREAEAELATVADEAALEHWRIRYLGRKGPLSSLFKSLGSLPEEERRAAGQEANRVSAILESLYRERAEALDEARLSHDLAAERLDVTLPGRRPSVGYPHPARH